MEAYRSEHQFENESHIGSHEDIVLAPYYVLPS